jgi:hypothetical protein
MNGIKGLNLGGADKDPATPPSGPAATQITTDPVSEPVKDTAKPSEAPVPGDTADVAAAKLGDERADAEDRTLAERAGEVEPTDKQKDAEGVIETPKTDQERVDAVAEAEAIREPAARWSSHPIARYTVGDYHFENGLLTLESQEDADKFQAMYDDLPVYEQTRMKKIDLGAAEAIVRERLATSGGATKGIDSSTGDRAPNKQVGTGSLTGE